MAKVFDDENVHDLWGLSPSTDVLELLHSLPAADGQHSMFERLMQADAVNLLQVGHTPDLSKFARRAIEYIDSRVNAADRPVRLSTFCQCTGQRQHTRCGKSRHPHLGL